VHSRVRCFQSLPAPSQANPLLEDDRGSGTRKKNCRTERSLLGFNNFDRQP
jgi:hypothetical protein